MSGFLSDIFGGGDAPPPPDYSPIISQLGDQGRYAGGNARDQFEFFKNEYARNRGVTDEVTRRYLQMQDEQAKNARADRNRYDSVFKPLQDQQIAEAQNYDSADRLEQNRSREEGAVAARMNAQRENTQRDLEGFGINPAATRYAGLDAGMRAAQAATQAAAGSQSDVRTQAQGRAMRERAVQLGNSLPGMAAGEYGQAGQFGAGAGNTTLAQTASGANTMGTGLGWLQGSIGANQAAGALTAQQYKDRMTQWKANQSGSGLGTLAGMAGAGIGAYFGGPAGASAGWNAGRAIGDSGGGGGGWDSNYAGSGDPDYQGPGYAQGGEVDMQGAQGGDDFDGQVPASMSPSHGQNVDDVDASGSAGPIHVNAGEFIMPRDVTQFYGTKHLHGLIEKARVHMAGGAQGGSTQKPKPQSAQKHQAIPISGRPPREFQRALPIG
jgi:hypothetical protein